MKRFRLGVFAATVGAIMMLLAAPHAKAETIAISAMGFVTHCPCPVGGFQEEQQNGVLKTIQQNSKFFAPVSFPSGVKVCRVSLVYRDFNASDAIRARLMRKTYATTGTSTFGAPTTMATVTSASGAVDTVRTASTTSISSGTISNGNSFYYVQVDSVTFNLDFLGVKIDTKPTSQTC